jgi:hypothetical protein
LSQYKTVVGSQPWLGPHRLTVVLFC